MNPINCQGSNQSVHMRLKHALIIVALSLSVGPSFAQAESSKNFRIVGRRRSEMPKKWSCMEGWVMDRPPYITAVKWRNMRKLLARAQQIQAWKGIAEHGVMGVIVIAITHYLSDWIHSALG